MRLGQSTLKVVLVLSLISLTTATVAAEESSSIKDLGTNEVWLNSEVDREEFEVACTEDDITSITVEGEEILENEDFGQSYTVETSQLLDISPGLKTAEAVCKEEEEDPETKEFLFVDLDVSLIDEEDTENSLVGYDQNSLGDGADSGTLNITIDFSSGGELDLEDLVFDFTGLESIEGLEDENRLNPEVTGEVGEHELNLTVYSEEDSVEFGNEWSGEETVLDIREAWNIEVMDAGYPNQLFITYDDLRSLSYRLNITHLGMESTEEMENSLYSNNFTAEMDEYSGNWYGLPESQRNDEKGIYNITLESRPDVDTGAHSLESKLVVDEESYSFDKVDVFKSMVFSGKIEDVNRRGVESYMDILDEGIRQNIEVGSNGEFAQTLEPGVNDDIEDALKYDHMEIGFGSQSDPLSILYMDNIDLSDNEGAIRYDYWHQANHIDEEGITPVNMMAVEFGYPLETPKIRMSFDPERVDPEELRVFECNNWNFFGEECRGEWVEIADRNVDIRWGSYYAEFPAEPYEVPSGNHHEGEDILLNAYVIGTMSDLDLNDYALSISGLQDGKAPIGEEIEFNGMVVDEDRSQIVNADVEIELSTSENSYTYEGSTDDTGRFTNVEGPAPDQPGNYNVEVTLDKTGFNSFTHIYDNRLEVIVEEGVAVDFPGFEDTLELRPGEEVVTEIKIENIGQKDIEDVSVEVDGSYTEYASLRSTGTSAVEAEDSWSTELVVQLSEDYCDGGCGSYPNFDLKVEADSNGETVEDEQRLYTTVVDTGPSQTSTETGEENETETVSSFSESIDEFETATGEFLASQGSLNLALGLIMVFMMVLAGAVKQKKNETGGRDSRGRERDRNRPVVQKPDLTGSDSNVTSPSPPEEDDDLDQVIEELGEEDEDVDNQINMVAEAVEEAEETEEPEAVEDSEDEEGSESFVCDVCGDEFETESGRRLHSEALH